MVHELNNMTLLVSPISFILLWSIDELLGRGVRFAIERLRVRHYDRLIQCHVTNMCKLLNNSINVDSKLPRKHLVIIDRH